MRLGVTRELYMARKSVIVTRGEVGEGWVGVARVGWGSHLEQ